METKYLSDGKKVVIVGTLNNKETIVQEIFVTDSGDEVPSGERFVVKSLHDEPVKPWKQREAEKAETQYDKRMFELENIRKEIQSMQREKSNHAKAIRSTLSIIEQLKDFDFGILADVAARNIKWAVESGYYWYKPKAFDDVMMADGRYDEGVKLISIHCKHDKSLSYRVNQYSDGSGSYTSYEFFNDDDLLNEWLLDRLTKEHEQGRLTIAQIKEIPINVPENIYKEVYKKAKEDADKKYNESVKFAEKQRNKTLGLADGKQ